MNELLNSYTIHQPTLQHTHTQAVTPSWSTAGQIMARAEPLNKEGSPPHCKARKVKARDGGKDVKKKLFKFFTLTCSLSKFILFRQALSRKNKLSSAISPAIISLLVWAGFEQEMLKISVKNFSWSWALFNKIEYVTQCL